MGRNPTAFSCVTCDQICESEFEKWEIPGVGASRTCFKKLARPESRELVRLFSHYNNGYLPMAGGLLDQPNYYLMAMEIIGAHYAKD